MRRRGDRQPPYGGREVGLSVQVEEDDSTGRNATYKEPVEVLLYAVGVSKVLRRDDVVLSPGGVDPFADEGPPSPSAASCTSPSSAKGSTPPGLNTTSSRRSTFETKWDRSERERERDWDATCWDPRVIKLRTVTPPRGAPLHLSTRARRNHLGSPPVSSRLLPLLLLPPHAPLPHPRRGLLPLGSTQHLLYLDRKPDLSTTVRRLPIASPFVVDVAQKVVPVIIPAQYFRDPDRIQEYLDRNDFLRDINNERRGDHLKRNMTNRFRDLKFSLYVAFLPVESSSSTWTERHNIIPAQYFRDPDRIQEYLDRNDFLRDINNERRAKELT
jgi:hypothetical protein